MDQFSINPAMMGGNASELNDGFASAPAGKEHNFTVPPQSPYTGNAINERIDETLIETFVFYSLTDDKRQKLLSNGYLSVNVPSLMSTLAILKPSGLPLDRVESFIKNVDNGGLMLSGLVLGYKPHYWGHIIGNFLQSPPLPNDAKKLSDHGVVPGAFLQHRQLYVDGVNFNSQRDVTPELWWQDVPGESPLAKAVADLLNAVAAVNVIVREEGLTFLR